MKTTNLILICVLVLVNTSNLQKKNEFPKAGSEKASQRQLQGTTEENYIIVYFVKSCSYDAEKGFASSIVSRNEYVENIDIGGETTGINVAVNIPEGTDVKINFKSHAESLEGFFNVRSDPNVVNIQSIDFSNFIWSEVTNMRFLFDGCNSLETINFGNFDTGAVTDVNSMFNGCSKITSIDVSKLVTSSITSMGSMFSNCYQLKSINLMNFNTSKVTDMDSMFVGCGSLETIDIDTTKFNTENVEYMNSMFSSCRSLKSIDLSKFNTAKVKDMNSMFSGCYSLTSLDLSNFVTSSVDHTSNMFYNCNSLVSLDLSNFDTTKVTNVEKMFYNCTSLVSLDISNFDFSRLDSEIGLAYKDAFGNLTKLRYINLKNVKKGSVNFSSTPLNDKENLKACQSEILIEKATNICCVFDIETMDCEQDVSPDEEEENELPEDENEEGKDKPEDEKDDKDEER